MIEGQKNFTAGGNIKAAPSALGSMNHGKSNPKIWLLTHLRNAVFQMR